MYDKAEIETMDRSQSPLHFLCRAQNSRTIRFKMAAENVIMPVDFCTNFKPPPFWIATSHNANFYIYVTGNTSTMHILILKKIGQVLDFSRHFDFLLLHHISQTKGTMGLILKPNVYLNTLFIFFVAREIVEPLLFKCRNQMAFSHWNTCKLQTAGILDCNIAQC